VNIYEQMNARRDSRCRKNIADVADRWSKRFTNQQIHKRISELPANMSFAQKRKKIEMIVAQENAE